MKKATALQNDEAIVTTRYKLYKSGKLWVVGGLTLFSLTLGAAVQTQTAHADATTTPAVETVQPAVTPAKPVTPTTGSEATVTPVSAPAKPATEAPASTATPVQSVASAFPANEAVPPTNAPEGSVSPTTVPVAKEVTAPSVVKAAVQDNIKPSIKVPASYLANANFPGPFTAGVNQVIPFEAFGGDGMLTRLLLKSSDKAAWSDNGTAKNAGLLPVDNLTHGDYFYEVDLGGNTTGKTDQALLDQLKANGTLGYDSTIKVYAAGADGRADLANVIATGNAHIDLQAETSASDVQQALTDNIHDSIDVPASYLTKANFPGPFTAGVNQVIPFEAFGGDGMLTRLLLNAADKAPWSDNGSAKNAALLPLDGLSAGSYFYEVDLGGATAGKSDQALLDQLKATGTATYSAVIKVYGVKDGKPDLTNLIGTKNVSITLHAEQAAEGGQTTTSNNRQQQGAQGITEASATKEGIQQSSSQDTPAKVAPISVQPAANVAATKVTPLSAAPANVAQSVKAASLPHTGEDDGVLANIGLALLAGITAIGGLLGFKKRS